MKILMFIAILVSAVVAKGQLAVTVTEPKVKVDAKDWNDYRKTTGKLQAQAIR